MDGFSPLYTLYLREHFTEKEAVLSRRDVNQRKKTIKRCERFIGAASANRNLFNATKLSREKFHARNSRLLHMFAVLIVASVEITAFRGHEYAS